MDYELYHYGVKGMKWGVRKSDNSPVDASRTTKRDIRRYDRGTRSKSTVRQREQAKEVEERWRNERKKTKLDAMTEERRSKSRRNKRIAKTAALATLSIVALPAVSKVVKNSVDKKLVELDHQQAAQILDALAPEIINWTDTLIKNL